MLYRSHPCLAFNAISSRRMAANRRSSSSARAAIPRPSASLILINDENQVLLVQRNPLANSFGNMHVFPGGNFDSDQDTSFKHTAIRETFEETGILLAQSHAYRGSDSEHTATLDKARNDIHSRVRTFPDFLREHDFVTREDLLPFTQWITPATVKRRFHTYFFVAFLESASGRISSTEHRLPTPDGGGEVISTSFKRPTDFLNSFRNGEISLMPPQYYLLVTLADILHGTTRSSHSEEQIRRLATGAFGRAVITPLSMPAPGNDLYMTYPGDESRGGPKGQLHRTLMRFGEKKEIVSLDLERNFDIFEDFPITEEENGEKSKL